MLNRTPSSGSTFFQLTPTFLTARGLTAHSYRVDRGFGRCVDLTANSRATRCTIALLVYVALQLGSVVLGIAMSHKPSATSASVMALEDAPKLPIDITERSKTLFERGLRSLAGESADLLLQIGKS